MASFLQLQLVLALVVMAGFAIARRLAGLLNRRRRVVFDNTRAALALHGRAGIVRPAARSRLPEDRMSAPRARPLTDLLRVFVGPSRVVLASRRALRRGGSGLHAAGRLRARDNVGRGVPQRPRHLGPCPGGRFSAADGRTKQACGCDIFAQHDAIARAFVRRWRDLECSASGLGTGLRAGNTLVGTRVSRCGCQGEARRADRRSLMIITRTQTLAALGVVGVLGALAFLFSAWGDSSKIPETATIGPNPDTS